MQSSSQEQPLKLAILQRVCPSYRVALFSKLTHAPNLNAKLFIGEDLPDSKVRSAGDLSDVRLQRLETRFFGRGRRALPWHKGLIKALRDFGPDVILCEGESHFLGYLQAIYYQLRHDRRCALIHWCYISLPGEPTKKKGLRPAIKAFFRRFFDAFLVYSSYSRKALRELGEPEEKIFVAVNVCDTQGVLAKADALKETQAEARQELGLADRFTVLYLGTLDPNKHPEVLLELAQRERTKNCSYLLLGGGPMLAQLREVATRKGLTNVLLPGRVTEDLARYCRASDVLLVPGRGGIVISEMMAYGLPSIVYQADGTEYDLIEDDVTGKLLPRGDVDAFEDALDDLLKNPSVFNKMGPASRQRLETSFSTENMIAQIKRAAAFAVRQRRKRP